MAVGSLWEALVLGVVEGVTEFLPVSSTGHLIITTELLGMPGKGAKTFDIFIQLGAILAVMWDRRTAFDVFHARFWRLALLLLVSFLPAAMLGLAFHHLIKEHLFSSTVVAWALIVGAGIMWIIEARPRPARIETLDQIRPRDALLIGLAQCVSLFPGASRAAATILGGMVIGLSRPLATEYSFLLAIPTIGAAAAYDLYKSRSLLGAEDIPFFAVGFAVSFLVALVVVRWLIGYVRRHDFRPFAIWRVAVGAAILLLGISATG